MLYQWTSAVIGICIGCLILYLVKHDYLRTSYAAGWIITAATIILVALQPRLVDYIGARLGIHYPPVLIIILGICFLLVKILTMDIDRSRREQKLRRLVQRLALLEARLGEEGEPFKERYSDAEDME